MNDTLPIMAIKKYTPEHIVAILNSIKKVAIEDGEIVVWMNNDVNPSVATSFE